MSRVLGRHQSYQEIPVRFAQGLAIVSAAAAGFCVIAGLPSISGGLLLGITVPIIGGIVLACLVAYLWFTLFSAALSVVTRAGVIGTIAVGTMAMLGTTAASSWGVASVISGGAAQRANMTDALLKYDHALDAAWAGVQFKSQVINAVSNAGAEMAAVGRMEEGNLAGRAGRGQAATFLNAVADGYTQLAARMRTEFAEAISLYAPGREILQKMLDDTGDDPVAFAEHANEVKAVIVHLNAFRPTDMLSQVVKDVRIHDKNVSSYATSAAEAIASNLDQAAAAADARTLVPAPDYAPLGGWVIGIALGVAPWLVFLWLLLTCGQWQIRELSTRE
jgi:hypothetical protein